MEGTFQFDLIGVFQEIRSGKSGPAKRLEGANLLYVLSYGPN